MAIFDFPGTMQLIHDMGIVDFFLPFLLVFAIVYGILDRSQIFGAERHDINAVIAMCIGFIFGLTGWAVSATQTFLPWVGVIAIALLGFLILISMFYPDFEAITKNEKLRKYSTYLIAIVLMLVLADIFGFFTIFSPSDEGMGELIGVIIVLGIIFGAIAMVTKSSNSGGSSGGDS